MNNYSKFWLEENEKINAFIIKAEYYDETYCLKDKPIDTSILKGIKDKTMNKIKNKVIENFKLIELILNSHL